LSIDRAETSPERADEHRRAFDRIARVSGRPGRARRKERVAPYCGRRLIAMALLLSMEACAAQRAAAPGAAEARAEEPAYERILGSFTIDPDRIILLTPRMCEQRLKGGRTLAESFARHAERFQRAGSARGEAAARLNEGAVEWFEGDSTRAYGALMESHRIFAELGDADGLAHAYEWLGYFFRDSGAIDKAAEHLSAAYRLFEALGNRDAERRVLGYADHHSP
jgi:hypothetical protein